MQVWYDACTGKHVRYAVAVARRLRKRGHEVILTTRVHPDTTSLAKALDERFVIVGKYNPASAYTRLLEGTRRQLLFCKMFEKNPPDMAVSHQSPDMCRVAFGLGIPTINTSDAPHATAANKLTLALSNVLIISKALPLRSYKKYGPEKIIQFDGVDEVAWVQDCRHVKMEYERPLVVVRQMETQAAYAVGKDDVTEALAQKLSKYGHVLFLSRYERRQRKNIIVPKGFVDSVNLAAHADVVITVGGTLAREAALQGTPSIVISTSFFGRLYVNEYVAKKGFPLFTLPPSRVLGYVKKYLGKRFDTKNRLSELENPVDVIERVIKEGVK
jgi:predicted glycosyltransferase